MFKENGPFHFNTDGKIVDNEFAWNANFNLLYFEQPVNVGYSYSTDPNDLISNDDVATENSYKFLTNFLEIFTELKNRELWFLGES